MPGRSNIKIQQEREEKILRQMYPRMYGTPNQEDESQRPRSRSRMGPADTAWPNEEAADNPDARTSLLPDNRRSFAEELEDEEMPPLTGWRSIPVWIGMAILALAIGFGIFIVICLIRRWMTTDLA